MADKLRTRQVALAATVMALVAGAFLLGRVTAPGDGSPATVPKCTDFRRSPMSISESDLLPDGTAYFSLCERAIAEDVPFGEPMGIVHVYAQPEGDDVIAWWYIDCGYPEGLVAVGAQRPTNCGSSDTTATAATP